MRINVTYFFIILFYITTIIFGYDSGLEENFVSNKVIVKLKNNKFNQFESKSSLKKVFAFAGVSKIEKLVNSESHQISNDERLNDIYEITYNSPFSISYVIGKVKGSSIIEYAEPHNIYTISSEPNDEFYNDYQWSLKKVSAEEAWDINKGSDEIIIAIVDTGVDFDHEDLTGNLASIKGYDFGSNDDDPREDDPIHGTYIAGVAAAVTNNNIGVASLGYNTKYMAIKVTEGNSRSFPFPFEAIKWAVDNGADIINCSWTGYTYSKAEQAMMDYAAENGALVVAAAGNDNKPNSGYPAAYNNVLSVTATDVDDSRWSASNYGALVDVAAPGVEIYSTWWQWDSNKENRSYTYRFMNGTSQATALTSGLAALVKNQFPNYSPEQIAEQIRVNSDDIDTVSLNYDFIKKLGYGRINAFKTLTNTNSVSVRGSNFQFSNIKTGSNVITPGDTFNISINYKNILNAVTGLTINLSTSTTGITIINNEHNVGSANAGEQFNNIGNEFTFAVDSQIPENTLVEFLITYSADNYNDFQWIEENSNPTYATQRGGLITLSIGNTGALGFDDHSDTPKLGEGFVYNGSENLIFEGSFMYGNSDTKVADNAHAVYLKSRSGDFKNLVPFEIGTGNSFADYTGTAQWIEKTTILGLETTLNSYTYDNSPNNKFVLLTYNLYNTGVVSDSLHKGIDSLFVGLFFDWDIPGDNSYWLRDSTAYDSVNNFAYALDVDKPNDVVVGAAFLNDEGSNFYPITNNGSDGDIIIDDSDGAIVSYSKEEKWKTLSSGLTKKSAGPEDISFVISGGPFSIDSGGTKSFSFVVAADNNLENLAETIKAARNKINDTTSIINPIVVPEEIKLAQNYPNPFNPTTIIEYELSTYGNVTLEVFNVLGQKVSTLVNSAQKPGYYKVNFDAGNLASGIYFYNLRTNSFSKTKKMVLVR